MTKTKYGATGRAALDALLARHPRLELEGTSPVGSLAFQTGTWRRSITLDSPIAAITEVEDNNPLVCADTSEVPGPALTLALIALSPLVQADLVANDPGLLFSFEPEGLPDLILGRTCAVAFDSLELGSVRGLNAMVEVASSVSADDLGSLFDEAYGRSFYVRSADGEWDTRLVANQPHALLRLRLTPGEGTSLLNVQVMADIDGKCGAAQVVHKLNVMCGFEESLGID